MCTLLLQNDALWDMGQLHCGIYVRSLLVCKFDIVDNEFHLVDDIFSLSCYYINILIVTRLSEGNNLRPSRRMSIHPDLADAVTPQSLGWFAAFQVLWKHLGLLRWNGMVTSSNGNIFHVTGHLCREFTGPGKFPAQRPVARSFNVFFEMCLNKRLSKQS